MLKCEITKRIEFDCGHRIPNHRSKCRNFHGHRYVLEVSLKGDIKEATGGSDDGMVLDFADVKTIMMEEIHDQWDHGFLVWEHDKQGKEALSLLGEKHRTVVLDVVPTVENLVQICFLRLDSRYRKVYGSNLVLSKVRLFETPTSWAEVKAEKSHGE